MTTVVNFALYFIIIFISNQNKIPFYFIALKPTIALYNTIIFLYLSKFFIKFSPSISDSKLKFSSNKSDEINILW